MRRLVASALGVLAAAAVVSACGSDRAASTHARTGPAARTTRSAPPARRATGDRGLAVAALVHLEDLPRGWGRQAPDRGEPRCRSNPFGGARAHTSSDRFVLHNTSFQESVAVFGSTAASRRALKRLDAPRSIACLRRTMRDRVTEQAEAPASPPELMRQEALGGDGLAMRFQALAPSQVGVVSGVIDALHLRVGRGVGALAIVSGPTTVTEAEYEAIVAIFERRLHGAFG